MVWIVLTQSVISALCIYSELPSICSPMSSSDCFLFFFNQQISTSPSVCFTHTYFFFIPSCSSRPCLPVLMFKVPSLRRLRTGYTSLSCFFIPPLYICSSVHPPIRILLTLACLIRGKQKEGKQRGSPFTASFHMSKSICAVYLRNI